MSTAAAVKPAVPLTFNELKTAVCGSAAAFRCRRRLQPSGGEGDKVFPPTFAGAVYASEKRHIPGQTEPVNCVLLDSVQSQANRMEEALQQAADAGEISLPIIEVDFTDYGPSGDAKKDEKEGRLLDAVGRITSLQVPHRLADAILRDSEYDGQAFRRSRIGRPLNEASSLNATPLYNLCPTALLFGMWDSTGPKGGLGAKFERAIVSEVVGYDAKFGLRTRSRLDPIITKTEGIIIYQTSNGEWTLEPDKAAKDGKGRPVKFGKGDTAGKVSAANLGNVAPSFAKYAKGAEGADPLSPSTEARQGRIAPGGVTIAYAEQITTLSLIALRRLRFPGTSGNLTRNRDEAARSVLATLGLCAATLAFEAGMDLRSRCLLWPEASMEWELLAKPGEEAQTFALDSASAKKLLQEAVAAAERAGLTWPKEPIQLKPSKELVKLVRLSQLQTVAEGVAEES